MSGPCKCGTAVGGIADIHRDMERQQQLHQLHMPVPRCGMQRSDAAFRHRAQFESAFRHQLYLRDDVSGRGADEQLGIFGRHLEPRVFVQMLEHDRVRRQRRREMDQRLLQLEQTQHLLVLERSDELVLEPLDLSVDFAEVMKESRADHFGQLEDEADRMIDRELRIGQQRVDDVRLVALQGDQSAVHQDDR